MYRVHVCTANAKILVHCPPRVYFGAAAAATVYSQSVFNMQERGTRDPETSTGLTTSLHSSFVTLGQYRSSQ